MQNKIPNRKPDGYYQKVSYWNQEDHTVMCLDLKDGNQITIATNIGKKWEQTDYLNGYFAIAKKLIELYAKTL